MPPEFPVPSKLASIRIVVVDDNPGKIGTITPPSSAYQAWDSMLPRARTTA
jgi:hypothetical protein